MTSVFKENDDKLFDTVVSHLKNGQDPNAGSPSGETPLRQAFCKGRMDVVSLLLDNGADMRQLRWAPLHSAVALGSVDDVTEALRSGDPASRDRSGLTPFLLACDIGAPEKAAALIDATAESDRYTDYHREPAIVVATKKRRLKTVQWLLSEGFAVDETAEFGLTALIAAASYRAPEIVSVLLEAGADINAQDDILASLRASDPEKYKDTDREHIQTAASNTSCAEVARLLMGAGVELCEFSPRVICEFTGAKLIPEREVTPEMFHEQKHRRFGSSNPEKVTYEFWKQAIRGSKDAGYFGRKKFGIDEKNRPAIWSYGRYGMSTTKLPDGRWVQVAGEHEDHYDPDFCIYSDVFVFDGKGGVEMFIYPRDVFIPTDFHTATLIGDKIILIGNLGYPEDREPGVTQVMSLDLKDFSISEMQTSGTNPGWISRHYASLEDNKVIVRGGKIWTGTDYIKNEDVFELNLSTSEWSKV